MNNNNIYNNNNFIGTTHLDTFKTTSNILMLNSSNFTILTSNILENHSSNFTSITSNILDFNSSNFTKNTSNYIVNRYDPLIKEENEEIILPPTILKHTYIYNSNLAAEIRFWCGSTSSYPVINPIGVPDYRVKIGPNGHLMCYYTYDPAINLTFGNGWIDIGNSIVALNASDANIGVSLTGLEIQIQNNFQILQEQLTTLLLALQTNSILTNEQVSNINNFIEAQLEATRLGQQQLTNVFSGIRNFYMSGQISYLQTATNVITTRIANNPAISFVVGLGGIAFAAVASAIGNLSYAEHTLSQITSNINIMSGITETRRLELLEETKIEQIQSLIDYTSNIYNATLFQGFINSNIQTEQYISNLNTNQFKINNINISNIYVSSNVLSNLAVLTGFINSNINTQQYIPNLKCNILNLNTGNIQNINGVLTNELIAAGKIKQNGILLDNIYLTSNHIYNLAYTYTAERQYPSKLYTTSSTEDTITLLGKLVYRQILYLDTSSISHGSGFYEIYSSSSTMIVERARDKLFNYNLAETSTSALFALNQYNSGTGNYISDNFIKNDYYGDWVILKLPQQIMLTRYRIYQRPDFPTRSPAEWKCYGSNDGINFTEITEASQMTRLTSYPSTFYEKTLDPSFTTQYQYIGFTFGKLLSVSGQTNISFSELQLFGKEIISNSIVSNIYTTSNACKNIIIYETPEVCKHFAFYILITTPININGTTYYKYDIDLSQYTKKGYIQIGGGSNDPYRIFKIRAFYATSYFGTLIGGLPDVVYADIFMSYKAAGSGLGQAGLNVCSIGNISNPSLTAVPPNNLFFMRNGANSIDYITVISKSTADVRVVIEDLLG